MFGTNSNDNTTQSDQDQTTAPAFDDASTDQVPMTSDAPSYLPSVPTVSDDSAAPADEAAALDSLVSAHDEPADTPSTDTPAASAPVPAAADDLLKLKQQALQQLTPLVGHLEQSAEDRFRTFMMMIQASDDQSLINSAYDAAQEIEDEKVRAQALLDVVNEINYFTQKEQPTSQD